MKTTAADIEELIFDERIPAIDAKLRVLERR
jgi:hypothetical protein